MAGVVRTRVGYAGGTKPNPTYYDLGDHSETVQVDYDPERVSFEQLLDVFWSSHNPSRRPWSRQYASIAFYQDEDQKRAILESMERLERASGERIYTEVKELDHFFLAEGYHQKYFLRNTPEIMREFQAMYPNEADIVNSTAAARANGYLGGHGEIEVLREELSSYGLSPQANQALLALVGRRAR